MTKKLYRSKKNRMIAGVCGGLAEYFKVDPVILRVIVVVFLPNLFLYLILWVIIPEDPAK